MLKKIKDKFISTVAILLLIFQSVAPTTLLLVTANTAFAQEQNSPSPKASVTPTTEPTPTPSDSSTLTPEPFPTASPEISPSPTIPLSPESSSTPTPADQTSNLSPIDNHNDQPNAPPNENPSPSIEQVSPTPTIVPSPTITPQENPQRHLSASIIEHASASSANSLKLDLNPSNLASSATLITDKADYAPTDIALISGTDFAVNTTYTLLITSHNPPPVDFETQVTTDDKGSFIYAYQLDGTYRPDYTVQVKDGSTVIATTTFTDTNSVTICHATGAGSFVTNHPNKSGNVDGHDGHPNDIIPPFDYGTNNSSHYPGKNWGINGQAIWNNGCHIPSGVISGQKFNDINGNHSKDGGEPGLQNWTINLTGAASLSVTTDSSGNYSFNNLSDGTYTVCEAAQGGWTQTYPTTSGASCPGSTKGYSGTINHGNSVSGRNFGNQQQLGSMIVKKVMVGGTDSFTFTGNVAGTISSNNGTLTVSSVVAGIYTSVESVKSEWDLTSINCDDGQSANVSTGNTGTRTATFKIDAGETVTCTFTNTGNPGSISGFKFEDEDGDGTYNLENGDVKKSDWTIFVDNNSNELLDNGEVSTKTDVNGNYSFSDLPSGQTYVICEVLKNGWYQTTPGNQQSPACYTILLPAGGQITNKSFGNFNFGQISGKKYLDLDGNGEDNGESEVGLEGWTIYLDINNNGQLDQGEPSEQTNSNGHYTFSNLAAGTYHVREVNQTGWTQTDPTAADSSIGGQNDGSYTVTVTSNANKTQRNFGNRGDLSITACKFEDSNGTEEEGELTAVNGWNFNLNNTTTQNTGESNCTTFNHLTPGSYTVSELPLPEGWFIADDSEGTQVVNLTTDNQYISFANYKKASITVTKDANPEETEALFAFNLNGDTSDSATVSAGESHKFDNLEPGNYTLGENIPIGWDLTNANCNDQSFINNGSINLVSGQNVSCSFSNTQRGKVIVTKFSDDNNNGVKDQSELTLSGWTINLASEESSSSATTDSGGQVVFDNLVNGSYDLSENIQEGWEQTKMSCDNDDSTTNKNLLNVSVNPGQTVSCMIGNRPPTPVLTLSKSNNKTGEDLSPGSNVLYALVVEATSSSIKNVKVTDLPPAGFVYRNGSWTADSNLRGDLKAANITTEPVYHSPGSWSLGDMSAGELITLTYVADVSNDQNPGLYKDIAWAQGTSLTDNQVLALAQPQGFVDTNFSGTAVNVVKNTQNSTGVQVERQEERQGEVLGASVALPDTGASNLWIILSLVLLAGGSNLVVAGILLRRKYE